MTQSQWQQTLSAKAMDGNGRCNDGLKVMDSGAQQGWTVGGQLDGEGRRVGDTTTMDDKDGASATAMLTWQNKGQCGIKTLNIDHQSN